MQINYLLENQGSYQPLCHLFSQIISNWYATILDIFYVFMVSDQRAFSSKSYDLVPTCIVGRGTCLVGHLFAWQHFLFDVFLLLLLVSEEGCYLWLATSWENLFMPYANNKGADQPAHPRSLISFFVVRCLGCIISLVSISEISRLKLASRAEQPVWVLPGRNPRRQVFSWRGSIVAHPGDFSIVIMLEQQHWTQVVAELLEKQMNSSSFTLFDNTCDIHNY